jgi:hypothetical protein
VASSALSQPFKINQVGQIDRILATNSGDPVMTAIVTLLTEKFGSLDNITQPAEIHISPSDQHYIVEALPYQDQWGLNWLMVMVVQDAHLRGQIHTNTQDTLWFDLAILGLTTVSSTTIT